jgi:uncharacterized membrane protein
MSTPTHAGQTEYGAGISPEATRNIRRGFVVLSLAAAACVAADWGGPLRSILVFAFLVIVPGAAVMSFTSRLDALAQAALAVVTSIAVGTVVASIAIWTRFYEPVPLFLILAGASVLLMYVGPWSQVLATPAGSHARTPRDEPNIDEDQEARQ